MKKLVGLTLIEVVLVLVVIAMILLASANQLQRYRANRDIAQAKATVSALANYATDLYLANCNQMVSQKANYACPTDFGSKLGSGVKTTYCYRSPYLVNPLYKNINSPGDNYLIAIKLFNGSTPIDEPQILIALPASISAGTLSSNTVLQKYIAALLPSQIAVGSGASGFYPGGAGYYTPQGQKTSQPNASNDPCLKSTGQPICLEWIITPNNWGSIVTQTNPNQALATQTNATIVQYVQTPADWKIMSAGVSKKLPNPLPQGSTPPQIQCPGLTAGQYYQQHF